jgi:uncharacterized protein YbbK (DUF523 family)
MPGLTGQRCNLLAGGDGEVAKVLVSACLAGESCRYDGGHCRVPHLGVDPGEAVLFCPEVAGGLPTPRAPAEISGGDGDDVLASRARVLTADGRDVTAEYLRGATAALRACREAGITQAILKSRSPSCGVTAIYDGTFQRRLQPGLGVTAALLRRHGIRLTEK